MDIKSSYTPESLYTPHKHHTVSIWDAFRVTHTIYCKDSQNTESTSLLIQLSVRCWMDSATWAPSMLWTIRITQCWELIISAHLTLFMRTGENKILWVSVSLSQNLNAVLVSYTYSPKEQLSLFYAGPGCLKSTMKEKNPLQASFPVSSYLIPLQSQTILLHIPVTVSLYTR